MSASRALLHLVPSISNAHLADAVAGLSGEPDLTLLTRADNCFMGSSSPYGATIETFGEDDFTVVIERCRRALAVLGPAVDRNASMAIAGGDIDFVARPATPTPCRLQYLMRRRHDFTHEAYLHRYREIHSQFGTRTPHIEAYVQHHVDLPLSAALGEATGLSDAACDSMSELHFRSVDYFLKGITAHPEVGDEAQGDEERFVDRAASFGFCVQVLQG